MKALRRFFRSPAAKDKAKGEGKMSKDGQIKKETAESAPKKIERVSSYESGNKGSPWICDCEVDPSKDLEPQGCWQLMEEGARQGIEGGAGQKRRKTL